MRRNHWWNVPFHLTGQGITTRPMGQLDGNPIFTIDFDFIDHQLHIHTLDGRAVTVPLQSQSVASFHDQTLQALAELGITVAIAHPHPFDLPDADRPFADDTEHASYDPAWARRYWQVLSQVNLLLEEFAARFSGKVSPVHHFWHTFDIAHPLLRPPRRPAADSRSRDPGGVCAGGDQLRLLVRRRPLREPAFYAYTAPEPARLADNRCSRRPPGGIHATAATWPSWAMTTPAPATTPGQRAGLLRAPYQAGARLAGWDVGRLARPAGSPTPGCAGTNTRLGSDMPMTSPREACWERSTNPTGTGTTGGYRPVDSQRRHALAVSASSPR